MNRGLLADLIRDDPFQPATQLWRAVEVQKLLDTGLPGGRGLDLGCGDGRLTARLLERAGKREVVGVEPDPAEAELARAAGIYSTVHGASGDRIPEPDSSFDWVLSNSVLEHIEDIDPVLGEVSRLLKPDGLFLFTVPSTGFHPALRGPLLPWIRRSAYLSALDTRLAHVRYWDLDCWRSRLRSHGLELDVWAAYLSRSEVRRWETVSRLTAGVLYTLLRRSRRPIEIQRLMGVRRHRPRLPRWAAGSLAAFLSAGVRANGPAACLYVRARKAT